MSLCFKFSQILVTPDFNLWIQYINMVSWILMVILFYNSHKSHNLTKMWAEQFFPCLEDAYAPSFNMIYRTAAAECFTVDPDKPLS